MPSHHALLQFLKVHKAIYYYLYQYQHHAETPIQTGQSTPFLQLTTVKSPPLIQTVLYKMS